MFVEKFGIVYKKSGESCTPAQLSTLKYAVPTRGYAF